MRRSGHLPRRALRMICNNGTLIRSKAPLRLSFAGGGTDVSPYCDERGGAVLSSTIDRFAFCTISPRTDGQIAVRSLDLSREERWKVDGNILRYDGNLDLIKAVVNHFDVRQGMDMFLHCEAPPGSGLGGSSTVMVSIIGAMTEWLNQPMSHYEMANLAYKLEREELGLRGGRQDQYAAVFGGFNFMEFKGKDVIVTPLRIKGDVLNELHYCMLLAYTGQSRESASIIDDQSKGYCERREGVMEALDASKVLARQMMDALMMGRIERMGEILDQTWEQKKRYTGKVSNERVDKIYRAAKRNGAIGGKISGAGGGGYMFFICKYDHKHKVANALSKLGAEIAPFNFDKYGLQTWRFRS